MHEINKVLTDGPAEGTATSVIAYKCRFCNCALTDEEFTYWVGCDACKGESMVPVEPAAPVQPVSDKVAVLQVFSKARCFRDPYGKDKGQFIYTIYRGNNKGTLGSERTCLSEHEAWSDARAFLPESQPAAPVVQISKYATSFTEPLEKGWLRTALSGIRLKNAALLKLESMNEAQLREFVGSGTR